MRYSITLALLLSLVSVTKAQKGTAKRAGGPLSEGQTLMIVHFDTDKAGIRPPDRAFLDSALMHTAVTDITAIRLAGYTDNSSSDAHNVRLSLQRAQTVRDYLQSKGWPDSLFKSLDGFGSSRPLNDNGNAGKKTLNRRVEIILTRRDTSALHEFFKDTTNLVGKNIILHNLNFYAGRHIPLPQGYKVMQELLVIMRQHPTLRIQIQGYICCNSDGFDGPDLDTHATDLSIQRAKFVYDFLLSQGIKKERMTYRGFGSSNKIYPEEKDDAQVAANRRVEIKIVSFGAPPPGQDIKRKNPQ